MRPKLMLLTEYSSRNDKAQDELDFGTCNVDVKRTITIFLSNITEVTSNWMLNYVKFPKKQTISKYTTTAWEEENLEKLDDPDVFEFSLAQVRRNSTYFRILMTNFELYRDRSRASLSRFARPPKVSSCHPCPRMSSRGNTYPAPSRSISE